jgi:uncharacterized OsmC-like protein
VGGEQIMVNFKQFDLLCDHTHDAGGTDQGPPPGDLLVAALVGCTAVYVGRNCERLGIPLESVHVGGAREIGGVPAPDGPLASSVRREGAPAGDIHFLSRMKKWVELRGPLTPEQVETVRYLVDHCAIGETLKRGVEIDEEIVLIDDPTVPVFGGRDLVRGAPASASADASYDDCCSGDVCEVPATAVAKANGNGHVSAFSAQDATPRVIATYVGNEQILVNFRQLHLLLDHARSMGGNEVGPSPGHLLYGSLASCTAVYVGRNCRRLGIPLQSVHVAVTGSLGADPAPDGPLAGAADGHHLPNVPKGDIHYYTRLSKYVEVRGPLTPEQFEQVKYFVDHCAIGETLKRGVEIDEEVVLVEDPTRPVFGGRRPTRSIDLSAPLALDDCCSGDVCDVPAAG